MRDDACSLWMWVLKEIKEEDGRRKHEIESLKKKEWVRVLVKKGDQHMRPMSLLKLLEIAYLIKVLDILADVGFLQAQEMGSSFSAPKQPKTSTSWPINGPRECS
ncbi:unnamed protein product [Prunus armeniaca]